MNIRDIVNEVRRVSRIKDKTIDIGNDSNVTKTNQEPSECPHEPRYREYYREGCYKCWECHKIIVD